MTSLLDAPVAGPFVQGPVNDVISGHQPLVDDLTWRELVYCELTRLLVRLKKARLGNSPPILDNLSTTDEKKRRLRPSRRHPSAATLTGTRRSR